MQCIEIGAWTIYTAVMTTCAVQQRNIPVSIL